MTIIEQVAHYIADELRLEYEGNTDGSVFFGHLPGKPSKAVCVYANDLRPASDDAGSRIQIVIRCDDDRLFPISLGIEILKLLDGRKDLLFVPNGDYISKIEIEKGFEFAGVNETGTQIYAANFRIYYCG